MAKANRKPAILKLFLLTTITMIAFAANSVLARAALGASAIDPGTYTLLRLAAGALMLAALVSCWSARASALSVLKHGNWTSALALFAYAASFSFAYIALDTGVGALILFAMVQATMVGWALYSGDRPIALEWAGLILAFGAFVWLVSPGLTAPDPLGAALMIASGIAWGIYSLRGRGSSDPLAATAGNFVLAVPAGLLLWLIGASALEISWQGILLAVASGAITSGLGYALWYRALRQLSATQGAIVQLTVPVIAAAGGVVFASEPITLRFAVCAALILGGVALAIIAKQKRV